MEVPLDSHLVYRRSASASRLSVYWVKMLSSVPLAMPLPVVSHVLNVASVPEVMNRWSALLMASPSLPATPLCSFRLASSACAKAEASSVFFAAAAAAMLSRLLAIRARSTLGESFSHWEKVLPPPLLPHSV